MITAAHSMPGLDSESPECSLQFIDTFFFSFLSATTLSAERWLEPQVLLHIRPLRFECLGSTVRKHRLKIVLPRAARLCLFFRWTLPNPKLIRRAILSLPARNVTLHLRTRGGTQLIQIRSVEPRRFLMHFARGCFFPNIPGPFPT